MQNKQNNFLQNFKMMFANSYHGGGHSSNKKAFTLIELLAIIVILAIIAVITVPIILNVIDNAKKGSAIDSAYGYKDAVQKFYVSKLYEDANFKFEDGAYTVGTLKTMGVSVDGTSPTDDSWVIITNNQVTDYSLKFDEWVINNKGNNQEATKNGTIGIAGRTKEDGRKYYDTKWISANPVYFDPTGTNLNCTEEEYNNNIDKLTQKKGCMKWYPYSENTDGTINMILDHNIPNVMIWGINNEDFSTDLGLTYPNKSEENPNGIHNFDSNIDCSINGGCWYGGPAIMLKRFKNDIQNWNSIKIIRQSHGTYINKNNFFNNADINNVNYIIDYTNYNARIITAQEIAYITNVNFDERIASDGFNVDILIYPWLLDNINNEFYTGGYWTSSTVANDIHKAWMIGTNDSSYNGYYLRQYNVGYEFWAGYRPIIAVSSSVLAGS